MTDVVAQTIWDSGVSVPSALQAYFLLVWVLASAVYIAEMIYYSRRAVDVQPEHKGRIWTLGILGTMCPIGLVVIWSRYFVPQLEHWNTLTCTVMGIGGIAALTHRVILRRILHYPDDSPEFGCKVPILTLVATLFLMIVGIVVAIISISSPKG